MQLSLTAVVVVVVVEEYNPPAEFCASTLVSELAEPPGTRTGEPGPRAAVVAGIAGRPRDLPGPA